MASIGFNHFPAIAAALPGALGEIVDETADDCVTNIQYFILAYGLWKTGDMYRGIKKEAGGNATTKNITSAMFYWVFQNFGTRYIAASPFVDQGVEATRPIFEVRLASLESRL